MAFMNYSNAQSHTVDLTYFHSCGVLHKQDWNFLQDPFLHLYFMGSFPFINSTNSGFCPLYCIAIRNSVQLQTPHPPAKSTIFSSSGMNDPLNTKLIFNVECLVTVSSTEVFCKFLIIIEMVKTFSVSAAFFKKMYDGRFYYP